jgi:TorA maturation chaperone TorD
MSRDRAASLAEAEAIVAEIARILSSAGVSDADRETLAESLRDWLPRFVRRCEEGRIDTSRIEAALLHLATLYARDHRDSLTLG